jgi:hypothetical protein
LQAYLPQHCLYFFPEPHAGQISILSILIILCVFPLFSMVCGQVSFYILSTIFVIFYIKYSSYVHKMCTNTSILYIFFVTYIDRLINQCYYLLRNSIYIHQPF